jgi:hypothetical protein
MPLLQRTKLFVTGNNSPTTTNCIPDGIQQGTVGERLGKEFDGACLHRLHRHRYVAVAGDKNDRHITLFNRNAFLQFEAIQAGKRNVQDQTAWCGCTRTRKELLRGSERLDIQAFEANQDLKGFSNGDIVIDDEHNGGSS